MAYNPNPNDDLLVDELLRGDRAAIEAFVKGNIGWMRDVARRYVCDDTADDCVQDALVSVFQALPTFQGRSRLKSWMHRILINCALMRLRVARRRKEASIDDMLDHLDSDCARTSGDWAVDSTPERDLERVQTSEVVRHAIDQLPASYRAVLVLRDLEGLDTTQVAHSLRLTEANVKVRLHRARSALRTLLEPALLPAGRGRASVEVTNVCTPD